MRSPARPALRTARLHRCTLNDRSTWTVVSLTDDEGTVGLGECSDGFPVEAGHHVLSVVWPASPDLLDGVFDRAMAGGGRLAERTMASGLLAAWEDLQARRSGLPLHTWLGGSGSPVRTYANINRGTLDRTPEGFAAQATAAVGAGFAAVKLAPFDGPADLDLDQRVDTGVQCLRAVRDAVGPDVDVMLDVHEHLPLERVLALAPALREVGLRWLEDAAPIGAVDALLQIKRAVDCPLAGGERVGDYAELSPAVRAGAVDVVMPDVKHAGGAHHVLQLVERLLDAGTEVSLHNPTGPVATATSGHVLSALGTGTLEVMVGEPGQRARTVRPAEELSGTWTPAPVPGVGVDLDPRHWTTVAELHWNGAS